MYAYGLCSLLGFPLFRSYRLSFTRFLCFLLFTCYCYFRWSWTYCGRYLLLGLSPIDASICASFLFFELRHPHSVLFGVYFICLVLLTLGLTSAKSRPHVQLIRAEITSNGSSEPPSESLSKLSSHQIPHCLVSEGTTTAKGLYANFYFVLSHYAFGGVRAQALSVLVLSASTSGSNWRVPPPRGSSSPAPLGHPLLPPLAVRPFFATRRILTPRCAACGSMFRVDPLSLPRVLRLLSRTRLCAGSTCTGADGCAFPSATAGVFRCRIRYLFALARLFRGVVFYWGGRTCFPGRDCV